MDLKSPLYDAAKGGKWSGQLPHAEIAAQSPQAKRPATPTLPGEPLTGFSDSYGRRRWIFDQPINPSGKLVLLALELHADEISAFCYPTIEKLAELTGYNEKTVRRAIKRLETAGYLRIQNNSSRNESSYYILTRPAIEHPQPPDFKSQRPNRPPDIVSQPPDIVSLNENRPPDIVSQPPDIVSLTPGHCVPDPFHLMNLPINVPDNVPAAAAAESETAQQLKQGDQKFKDLLRQGLDQAGPPPGRRPGGKNGRTV